MEQLKSASELRGVQKLQDQQVNEQLFLFGWPFNSGGLANDKTPCQELRHAPRERKDAHIWNVVIVG